MSLDIDRLEHTVLQSRDPVAMAILAAGCKIAESISSLEGSLDDKLGQIGVELGGIGVQMNS